MRKNRTGFIAGFVFVLALSFEALAGVRKGPYLIYEGDPSRMTVLWQLDTYTNCTIRWGLSTDYSSGSASVEGQGDAQYKYTITGLLPGTLYYYHVDEVGSGSFRTAPEDTATSVKLLAFSDPQGPPQGYDGACAAMIDTFTRDPLFQTLSICAGDRADEDIETVWDAQYFARGWEHILDFLARVPVAGPRGNHERAGAVFRKYYPYPYVGDFYWSFDYGPVHITVLDQFVDYAPGSTQYSWLVSDLSATSKPWKIITFHRPGWSAGGVHGNDLEVQEYIQPLCLQYGIDLVISGDNHYYARADVSGIQHLTAGGGGDYLYQPVGGEYIVLSEGTFHHLEIDIQGREAEITARRRDGTVIETFTISHGASIRITSPQSGSTVVAGQTTNVQARVLPAGGTCTGVHFYADRQMIGRDDTEPYEVVWVPGSSASSISLSAEALVSYLGSTETIASAPVTVNVTAAPIPQSFTARISQGTDDAEESASGSMYLDSSDLEFVYDGSNQKVGMRFNGIPVPRGATIANAHVQFMVDEVNAESTSLTIQGENVDQATTFASVKNNVSSRTRTAAAVSWSPNPWTTVGAVGTDQRTPDIASVIQEIVDRPGWASGNSLAIIITGTGHRTAVAYEGGQAGAPRLQVDYYPDGTGNSAPVAVADAQTTSEDTPLVVGTPGVLGNDTDSDGNTLTAVLNTGPSHGSLALNANGSFTYTPTRDFNGTDTFTYHANDGKVDSNVATVTITVSPVNDPPAANNQSVTTAEDTSKAITLTGSDADGDSLTYSVVTPPAHGSLGGAAPNLMYTPAPDYNGADSFTFKVNDGTADSDPATVSIMITAVNDPPVAANDTYSTNEDAGLTISAPGVLANDTDADGNTLTATLNAGPSHGTLSLNVNGSFIYTPSANFYGSDSFTYRANDGAANSNVATVIITITSVNDPPAAANDTYSTNQNTLISISAPGVLANDRDPDGDTLTAVLSTGPTHGTLALSANGGFTYTPSAGFSGTDSFTYLASDGAASSNVATAIITITAVNSPPVAANDAYSTNEDAGLTVSAPGVLANDNDPDGNTLTAVLNAGPSNGTLALKANGSFTYTPSANFSGFDSFTYRAYDGATTSNLATVVITITTVNDPPVAAGDAYSADQNTALTISAPGVLANDTDPDGDTLTANLSGGPSYGTLALNANGSFTYTPNMGFSGTDSFSYLAYDGTASSNPATVTITVRPSANKAPIVNAGADQTVALANKAQLAGSVSDDGLPSGTLTVKWLKVSGPANVTFGNVATPNTTAKFAKVGVYILRLTASDGQLVSSDDVTVNVTKR